MLSHKRHKVKTGDLWIQFKVNVMRLKCPAVDFNIIVLVMRFICPVQSKTAGENNVDKVTFLFIEATFDGVFCNHVGRFLKVGGLVTALIF